MNVNHSQTMTVNYLQQAVSFFVNRAQYSHVQVLSRILSEEGMDKYIRPGMGLVIFTLFEEENLRIKEISKRTKLSQSHLTSVIGKMLKNGLITRERDENDGRAVCINLTPLGRSLEPKCIRVVERLSEIQEHGLSKTEIDTLTELLDTVVNNMQSFLDESASM